VEAQPVEVPPIGQGAGAKAVGRLPGGRHLSPGARVAVVLVAVAAAIAIAALWRPWGFIVLGAVTAALAAVGVATVQASLMPLFSLAGAARPLALPLFVFVAAGVINESFAVQFVVGLAALSLAWLGLVRPDRTRLERLLNARPKEETGLRRALRAVLPVLVGLPVLLVLLASVLQLVGKSSEASRTVFVLAVGAVAAAAILRLMGYARTAFRAALALALFVLLWRVAVEIGLVTSKVIGGVQIGTLAAVAGALLAVTAVVEIVTSILARDAGEQTLVAETDLPLRLKVATRLDAPIVAGWLTDGAAIAGTGLAVVSAVFMAFAVYAASQAGGAEERDRGAQARETVLATPPSQMTGAELARAFAPVLAFTSDERWRPIPVDGYIENATLRDWEGRTTEVHGLADLKLTCPGVVRSPCYVLTQACKDDQQPDDCAAALPDDTKAVYVRVARVGDWNGCTRERPCADGSPNPFANARGPYADATTILVQYWLFYPYNDWSAPVAVGDLQEIHAADWEAITVGLSDTEPLWVGYSQHCGGSWANWASVPVAPSDPRHLRPLVAVAEGSQANYRLAKASRVPNFAECSGIPKDLLRLASYAANVRDRTDDATLWSPAPSDLKLVTAETLPMSFPGTWAPFARMQLRNLRKTKRLGKDTPGPATPTYQALWQSPMRTIFAGRGWKEG
jgi:hypothetical protein